MNIKHETLQAHLHEVGLEKFLSQIEDVLGQAEADTALYDVKDISLMYERAKWSVHKIRRQLFTPTRSRFEMEEFIYKTMMDNLQLDDRDRLRKLDDESLKSEYNTVFWIYFKVF